MSGAAPSITPGRRFRFSVGRDPRPKSGQPHDHQPVELTVDELAERLASPSVGPKGSAGFYLPAVFAPGKRGKADAIEAPALLMVDLDFGAWTADMIRAAIPEPSGWIAHTTASHTLAEPKWRVVFPLGVALDPEGWARLARAISRWFGFDEGATGFDRCGEKISQPFYWPTKATEDAPFTLDGDIESNPISKEIADRLIADERRREAAAADEARREREAREDARRARAARFGTNDRTDVIAAWNSAHGIDATLERYGYTPPRASGGRWLSPNSSKGIPAVRVWPDEGRFHSHHACDAGTEFEHGDAFDLFRLFGHGGDWSKAIRSAAVELGIGHEVAEEKQRAAGASARNQSAAGPTDIEETAPLGDRLTAMGELEYQTQRAALAKEAGLGVGALDSVRKEAIKSRARKQAARVESDPWPDPVNGVGLAGCVEAALRRFVVLDGHSYVLATLWAIGTHAYDARGIFPMLLARSPQPACGKSTLLDVLERIVSRPFMAGNASLATLFRSAATGPTQLLDELDRWLERDPEVAGFLCAGWQSGRPFLRCDPETLEIREFVCFGPKALALIGDVADEAVRSRCVVVDMRRALPGERPVRFRAGREYADLAVLRAQAARWAADHRDEIGAFELGDGDLPELSGRAADNAEALLAVAVAIGGDWEAWARRALTEAPREESQDIGAMLLVDLRDLLDELPGAVAVSTDRVLERLLALDDRPWPTGSHGRPITADWLRRKLRPFGARPERHYIDGKRQRGYAVEPLREAVARYLPLPLDPSEKVSRPAQMSHGSASGDSEASEIAERDAWDTWDISSEGSGEGVVGHCGA